MKSTHSLKIGIRLDDQMRYIQTIASSRTLMIWRRRKGLGWDGQIRHLKSIDLVHLLPGDGWRGWVKMIR